MKFPESWLREHVATTASRDELSARLTAIDGIASGVLPHQGTVYFTNIPSLTALTGTNKAETRKDLSTGYGVRFNFTGHDMHGLIVGPDGKVQTFEDDGEETPLPSPPPAPPAPPAGKGGGTLF